MDVLRPIHKTHPVSQGFGVRPDLYPWANGHNGIDFSAPEGSLIYAAADGVVTMAVLDPQTVSNPGLGYGFHIRIKHENGWTSVYGHFSQLQVKTGQKILAGEVIGLSGNTGFSTGPHLHFEVRTGVAIQSSIDPSGMIVETLPPKEPMMTVRITAEGDRLRVRSGPGTEYGVLRQLSAGDQAGVIGLAGSDVWLWIGDGYIKYQAAWVTVQRAKTVIVKRPLKRAGGVV